MMRQVFYGCGALVAAWVLSACGAAPDDSFADESNGGSGAGTAGAGTGNGGGTGASGGMLFGEDPSGGGSGASSRLDDCGGDVYRGESSLLDMYVLMDRSGSMMGLDLFGFQIGQNIWQPVGTAIGDFVTRQDVAGTSAGIQFFPLPPDADEPETCDVNLYSSPAAPIGPLPQNGQAIQQAILANGPPSGGTPTRPAMEGAMSFAKQWATNNPAHKTILVLATDGEPNDCNSDVPSVAAIAANGRNSAPSIDTYVIGIGNVAGLNEIAAAGGSGQAIIVDADPAVAAQQFFDAMSAIRGRAVPCDFGIPSEGQNTPNLINVKFASAPGGEASIVPNVGTPDRCGPEGGWYYDDPQAPNRIISCPATCDTITATEQAEVSVVVGCEQVIQ